MFFIITEVVYVWFKLFLLKLLSLLNNAQFVNETRIFWILSRTLKKNNQPKIKT